VAQALVIASGLANLVAPIGRRFLLLGHVDWERGQRVPWAVAAFLLLRRDAWDAVGGFDESRWMYAEDLDLGWRLADAGWATRYEPGAVVDHESAAATEQAWGDSGKVERWQRETYAWLRQRRGRRRASAFAAIQALGCAIRLLVLIPAARIAPTRFARRRDAMRWWLGLHRDGIRAHANEVGTPTS
jgi:GT2 family glycosyltransferase